MAILDDLDSRLKTAMKAREQRVVDTLRMVRAEVIKKQNAKDYSGKMDDGEVQEVIAAYVKSLQKALPEFEKSDGGREMADKLRFEITYLSEFLPDTMDEPATRRLVAETIQSMEVTDPKRSGQVMGSIMKSHKGRVDPTLVRRLVDEALSAGEAG
jgi:hypothetical protein